MGKKANYAELIDDTENLDIADEAAVDNEVNSIETNNEERVDVVASNSKKKRRGRALNKKAKKKLIIAIISILLIIAVLVAVVEIIEYQRLLELTKPIVLDDYNFYPANFDENIFEDEKYLEKISEEHMRYCDASLGVTVGIDMEKLDTYSPEVLFMIEYVQDIINGDHESYNARFSEDYYKYHTPLDRFTMQKVYDVLITQKITETVQDEKTGVNYTKYSFELKYRILENNGTFRKDIGDGSRTQSFIITDRTGVLLIDAVGYERIKTD